MNTMKNVIALGLIACAAFASNVNAKELSVSDIKFYCVDRNGASSADWVQYQAEYDMPIAVTDMSDEERAAFDALDGDMYMACAVHLARHGDTTEEWTTEQREAFAKEHGDLADFNEVEVEKFTKEYSPLKRKQAAEVRKMIEERIARHKVAELAKAQVQTDCTDYDNQMQQLSDKNKAAWTMYMEQRQSIRDMGQGAYDAATLNTMVNENTAELKQAAEQASKRYEQYAQQCQG